MKLAEGLLRVILVDSELLTELTPSVHHRGEIRTQDGDLLLCCGCSDLFLFSISQYCTKLSVFVNLDLFDSDSAAGFYWQVKLSLSSTTVQQVSPMCSRATAKGRGK